VRELPVLTVVLGRVALAAAALNLLLLVKRDPMPLSPRLWRDFFVLGLLNNVIPFTLIVWGETRIASGLASILNATTPLFTVLAAHVLTRNEKLSWGKGVGVLLGFCGVGVLVGPGLLLAKTDVLGQAACLLAALTYGFAGIYGRRFRGVPPLKIATGQVTASTIILLPMVLVMDHPWTLTPPSAAAWGAFAGIALLCTALAYIIYFRILAVAGATNLLLVTFLLPVSALVLGYAFLGEKITAQSLEGMALIGAGLAAIDGRLFALTRR
jgi:drug/metabolite transporter (DMT)-like permease